MSAKTKLEWVSCPICGHILFKIQSGKQFNIQVKCNACKWMLRVTFSQGIKVDIDSGDRKFPPNLERKNR